MVQDQDEEVSIETYGAPREDRGVRGVRIEHDSYGRVRRVGKCIHQL